MTSKEFCLSIEWIILRRKVLNAFGKRCMKCNKLFKAPHVDHIKPRSKYGHLSLEITNYYSKNDFYKQVKNFRNWLLRE